MKFTLLLIIVLFVGALLLAWFLGPRPEAPSWTYNLAEIPTELKELESWVNTREEAESDVLPHAQAAIEWADPDNPSRTDAVIVFLHGFSAQKEECAPMHRKLAAHFGANLYLARLNAHGKNAAEPLLDFKADDYLKSAHEALLIGKAIGEKVIVLSSSTGSTLALHLAAEYPELVDVLLLNSPNIDMVDQNSHLLVKPWGLQLARLAMGGKYRSWDADAHMQKYWTTRYRLEALQQLRMLVSKTMVTETFSRVKQPLFLAYYYKDEQHQDDAVSVAAMRSMFDQLGTPAELKLEKPYPEAEVHIICNGHHSPVAAELEADSRRFLEEVVGIKVFVPSDPSVPEPGPAD